MGKSHRNAKLDLPNRCKVNRLITGLHTHTHAQYTYACTHTQIVLQVYLWIKQISDIINKYL